MNDKPATESPPTDVPPPDGAETGAAPFRRTVTICNRRGLHARAAARFVKLADQFDAEIVVAKNGASVSGRSIMGLMMLAAGPGTSIELRGSGAEAERAIDALAALICGGFDED
jgi:phosphocarrier protein HPr